MSRRARLEEEKLKQLNDELKGEEDKIKLQKERIYAPIIWKRLTSGIRIEDLKQKYFEQALKIVEVRSRSIIITARYLIICTFAAGILG